jgi:translation elongation factor EF-G
MFGYADELLSKTNEHAAYSTTLVRYRRVEDPAGDDRIGVTANKPQKPKPRRGARPSNNLCQKSIGEKSP